MKSVESRLVSGGETDFSSDGIAGVQDDIWSRTRTATYVVDSGASYALTTNVPLRRPVLCRYPTSGVLELVGGNLAHVARVDYGAGDCDGVAILTYGKADLKLQL